MREVLQRLLVPLLEGVRATIAAHREEISQDFAAGQDRIPDLSAIRVRDQTLPSPFCRALYLPETSGLPRLVQMLPPPL